MRWCASVAPRKTNPCDVIPKSEVCARWPSSLLPCSTVSSRVKESPPLPDLHLLLVLRHSHIPPQLLLHQLAEFRGSIRLPVNQVRCGRPAAKSSQPLQ